MFERTNVSIHECDFVHGELSFETIPRGAFGALLAGEVVMSPRIALGIWLAVSLFLIVAALTMRLFGATTKGHLGRQIASALIWPLLLFSSKGRAALLSIIKDTQEDKS